MCNATREFFLPVFALTLRPIVDYGDQRCSGRNDCEESGHDCPSQRFAKAPPLSGSIFIFSTRGLFLAVRPD